jgi:hypothetical protein
VMAGQGPLQNTRFGRGLAHHDVIRPLRSNIRSNCLFLGPERYALLVTIMQGQAVLACVLFQGGCVRC